MDTYKSPIHPGGSNRLSATPSRGQQEPAGLLASRRSPPALPVSSEDEWTSNDGHTLNQWVLIDINNRTRKQQQQQQ